ncbi:MAG: DUF3857 domain-containing protein [Ginsengibacter sp.]
MRYEKEPAWVTVNNTDYNNKGLEVDAEDGYLDIGYEKQVSLIQQASYYKKTIKILSEAGVQNGSEISVTFDPAFEQLIFHSIRIIRDGKSLNKLELANFKTIQQEKELDMHMYNGSLTALLVLDDVRKGDIIESSHTIKGFNPIFNGKYSDTYNCRYGVPVGSLYYKLIVPENKNITIKNRQTNITPVVTRERDKIIYEWKAGNVAALHLESKTPGWYDPYASIMVSEFDSWNEVSKWATALFPRNLELSSGLQQKINNIKKLYPDNEARALTALRFTQDDIRYMAIEIGINSHKPSHPNKIFAQRFGDCKDKSYLLVTMLNEMGIEAHPVLINTTYKKAISDWLPSASAFDHCIIQAKVNGKVYWFDPTISFQRGSINDIAYPDYQIGLVINESSASLTPIPFHDQGLCDIKEVFSILGISGLARLKVTTKNTGSFADEARFYYNNNSLYEIKNNCKDFYAYYFNKIIVDSSTYNSNELTGSFTTTEYYTVNDIWIKEDAKKKLPFSSFVINSVMNKPSDKNRTMPFYLTYPARYKEQVEIHMPEDWPIKSFNDRVECAGFRLTADGHSIGNRVTLNYYYENLKDNIMPDEAASFFSNYEEAYKDTGYELYYNADGTTSLNSSSEDYTQTTSLFPKMYTLLGVAVLIIFFIRRQRQKQY